MRSIDCWSIKIVDLHVRITHCAADFVDAFEKIVNDLNCVKPLPLSDDNIQKKCQKCARYATKAADKWHQETLDSLRYLK